MPSPTIAVFDSGFGGLIILRSLVAALPGARFVFLADQAHAPYGSRSKEDITKLSTAALDTLRPDRPDILVVACNTVTSVAISRIREQWSPVLVVGVEPAVKPAAILSRHGRIGVLATPATLQSASYQRLKQEHAGSTTVIDLPRSDWVAAIEGDQVVDLRSTADDIQTHQLDTLVLGCTHFPIIRQQLAAEFPNVTLVDSERAVARRVVQLLSGPAATDNEPEIELRTTNPNPESRQRLQDMWQIISSQT